MYDVSSRGCVWWIDYLSHKWLIDMHEDIHTNVYTADQILPHLLATDQQVHIGESSRPSPGPTDQSDVGASQLA